MGDKLWMKNIAHIAGAGEDPLATILITALKGYERTIEDSLYGANVTMFTKTSTNSVQQLSDADLVNLFNQGLSVITYYGHSSATTLEFNLDEPANYNNQGKYPMFLALGCNAGNTFDYNESRFTQRNYLSDKYVLAPNRGSINFIASSHFGIVHYLDIWNSRAYVNMARTLYGGTIGDIMKKTIEDVYGFTSPDDFFARCNAEETILNGDPAIRLNQQAKPDYAITDTMVKVAPNFISVADLSFKVNISVVNLGKVTNKKIVVETKRQYPDGSVAVIKRDTLLGTRYRDTLSFNVPIDPTKDKGANRIYVTVDADNEVDELFETNNSTYRDFIIFEDEARPIYPYDYSIVNNKNITFKVSTANPFSSTKQYRVEIDTTEQFNSSLKVVQTITSAGGMIEFNPGVNFIDNTVYYWRVAPVPASGTPVWKNSSFVYIANSSFGYNQSHYFQFQKSTYQNLTLNLPSRTLLFDSTINSLMIKNGVFPTASGQEADFSVSVNGTNFIRSACVGFSVIFNVFDPHTFKPLENPSSFMNSGPVCIDSRLWNFEFSFQSQQARKNAMDFMDWIPDGSYVVVRNITGNGQNADFIDSWMADTLAFGSGNSLYHRLKSVGLTVLDQYTSPKAWAIVYQKNASGYTPVQGITSGIYDLLTLSASAKSPDSVGYITSPLFGPAKSWKEFHWQGTSVEASSTDGASVHILGIKPDGRIDTLFRNISLTKNVSDISSINAAQYPYLQLVMRNIDSVNFSPYQLKYWRLTYDPVPEGAVSPNVLFSMKDTFDVGEPLSFKLAFKNISDASFADSMKVKVIVYDRTNTARTIPIAKQKSPKVPGEVANVQFDIDTKLLVGSNTLFVDINPDNDQPEQYHFNNFVFKNFYVVGDTLNPLMDVTFDNVHILNRDLVSSKPNILIKVKDEAKWMLLNDQSKTTVQVRYPDNTGSLSSNSVTKTFNFNSDTLRFIPATGAPNASNTASMEFKPVFEDDGEYELIVTSKDMSDNAAGSMSYRVTFQVINKAMISNMLNYPNPFTTSTAFVFTLTGSEVPQNMKIQILTVTGKVVREITKNELGPLHIGRNITEYKWDGTDQYGQKLANGVYIYRVVTNLNGKSLDKYTSDSETTDKYFNKGYGKMYLMR
ncbi:MAG: hypothetical protein EOO06_15070 [Chitinophagaceae bacterium]|nr:MAG: hypothetical protein EOO06_15070 [Chitinophagaceae bacterium]